MTSSTLVCPACKAECLDVRNYISMMVLRQDVALFTLKCPTCGATVSTLQSIPRELIEEVQSIAVELGAGMCRV